MLPRRKARPGLAAAGGSGGGGSDESGRRLAICLDGGSFGWGEPPAAAAAAGGGGGGSNNASARKAGRSTTTRGDKKNRQYQQIGQQDDHDDIMQMRICHVSAPAAAAGAGAGALPLVRETPSFCAIWYWKRSSDQDMLGTNIGKAALEKERFLRFFGAATRCAAPHRTWGAGLRDRYRRLRQEQPARSDPVRDGAGSALLLLLRLLLLFLLRFASSSNGGNGRQHGSHHGCCGGRLLRVLGSAAVDPEHEVRETPFLRRFYI
eukprot:COSAG06_NODE_4154_length_4503_cov_3.622283_7_plen_263_part_00